MSSKGGTDVAVYENPDKLVVTLAALRRNPRITDEELAPLLGLRTRGIARFWRVKAQLLLQERQESARKEKGKD